MAKGLTTKGKRIEKSISKNKSKICDTLSHGFKISVKGIIVHISITEVDRLETKLNGETNE